MINSKNLGVFFAALAVFFSTALPLPAATESCTFSRNLEVKTVGEDVRCLQKYLNGAGYTIATSGIGSPGKETSIFGELTKQAVKKWQAANGVSSTGNFGPLSRQKFASLSAGAVLGAASPSVPTTLTAAQKQQLQSQISSLLVQIENLKSKREKVIADRVTKEDAKAALDRTETDINNAQSEVNSAYSRGDDVDKANDYIREAKDKLEDTTRSYNKDRYEEVMSSSYEAEKLVDKALKEIDSDTLTLADVKEVIDEAQKAFDKAESEISKADQNGYDVSKSESKLRESETTLEKAKDYYDDRNYSEANTYAKKADDLADEALDAIDDVSKSEARTKINEADDAVDEAEDDIDYAKDRNRSVGNAESMLESARSALASARSYYDEREYSKAVLYAKKSIEYTNKALDEF